MNLRVNLSSSLPQQKSNRHYLLSLPHVISFDEEASTVQRVLIFEKRHCF